MTERPNGSHAPSISIVVISYNYAEYLAEAIDSALAQDSPVEVFVVDDGSTDGSQEIIRSYGQAVHAIFKENGGNSSVVNLAVPTVSGDLVMFLDADDLLDPRATTEVAAAWRTGCAKVQFRLALIDAAGTRRGVDPPSNVVMPTGDVLPQVLTTGRYVTPVTSGNAYSRETLKEHLLPIPEEDFRNTNDGYLNPLCPFFGSVISVDKELGSYRLHGRNIWAMSGEVDLGRVRQRVTYDLIRQRYLMSTAHRTGNTIPGNLPLQDPLHVFQRLVSLKGGRQGHPAEGDNALGLLRCGVAAVLRNPHGADSAQRLMLMGALPLVAVLPRAAALRVCSAVLGSRPRPAWVRWVAGLFRRLSGQRMH